MLFSMFLIITNVSLQPFYLTSWGRWSCLPSFLLSFPHTVKLSTFLLTSIGELISRKQQVVKRKLMYPWLRWLSDASSRLRLKLWPGTWSCGEGWGWGGLGWEDYARWGVGEKWSRRESLFFFLSLSLSLSLSFSLLHWWGAPFARETHTHTHTQSISCRCHTSIFRITQKTGSSYGKCIHKVVFRIKVCLR